MSHEGLTSAYSASISGCGRDMNKRKKNKQQKLKTLGRKKKPPPQDYIKSHLEYFGKPEIRNDWGRLQLLADYGE
jgi:hypothetical protein